MIGAIAGDIIGSVYEVRPIKTKEFQLFSPESTFTDDSVLTIAISKAITENSSYLENVKRIGRQYPNCGYGASFIHWLLSDNTKPYYSFGNGSAMRASPVGFAFSTKPEVLKQARKTAEITHNHPEGIKGAQAIALAVFLALKGDSKEDIRSAIANEFGYDLRRSVDSIRPDYHFDVTCQGSVPQAIISFLEADSYEDTIRNAISLGGDSDTLACMAGGIAEAFYKEIPEDILLETKKRITPLLWNDFLAFYRRYGIHQILQHLED